MTPHMQTQNILHITIAFTIALVFGALATSAVIYHSAYISMRQHVTDLRLLSMSASYLQYGVAESIDTIERTITVRMYRADGDERQRVIYVSHDAFIARQEMKATDGIYDTIAPPLPATLADIRAGDRIALMIRPEDDSLTSSYILFGNPL